MRMPLFLHFLFLSSALTASVDSSASPASTATSVAPLSTACADIVNSCGALEDLLTFPTLQTDDQCRIGLHCSTSIRLPLQCTLQPRRCHSILDLLQ